jgi:fatty acid desaturase
VVEQADELLARTAETRRYVRSRWDDVEARANERARAGSAEPAASDAARWRAVSALAVIGLIALGAALGAGEAAWLVVAALVTVGIAAVVRAR